MTPQLRIDIDNLHNEIDRLKDLIERAQWDKDPSKAAGFDSLRKFCDVDGLNFQMACCKARAVFLVQHERALAAEAQVESMKRSLIKIARGDERGGSPLNRRVAQEVARDVLSEQGYDWTVEGQRDKEPRLL